MEGLLGKILRDLQQVPERKLDLLFDDVPPAHHSEKLLGSLTKHERQIFCLYRDVLLKIGTIISKGKGVRRLWDMDLSTIDHQAVHPLDSEAVLLNHLLFTSVRYRLPVAVHSIAVCRGGVLVEARDDDAGVLDVIMQAILAQHPQLKSTVH